MMRVLSFLDLDVVFVFQFIIERFYHFQLRNSSDAETVTPFFHFASWKMSIGRGGLQIVRPFLGTKKTAARAPTDTNRTGNLYFKKFKSPIICPSRYKRLNGDAAIANMLLPKTVTCRPKRKVEMFEEGIACATLIDLDA
jgi:hypothetical protein